MKRDVSNWCYKMASKYKMTCIYIYTNECYSFTKRGYGIQNFTLNQFYGIPKRERENMLLSLLKVGLNHNIGEKKLSGQLQIPHKIGKLIAKFG